MSIARLSYFVSMHMPRRKAVGLGLAITLAIVGCATQEPQRPSHGLIDTAAIQSTDISNETIELNTSIHFTAPDGTPMLVAPNEYLVEWITDRQLQLVPSNGGSPLIVAADTGTHDLDVSTPFPLIIALNDDARDLVLLMPDGTALDARGSLSGVQTRDTVSVRRHYQLAYQLDQATGQVQFGNGVTGQQPLPGQSTLATTYRQGDGTAGNVASPTSQNSELEMINLQSMVSQRQVAVSLAQNIFAAQNEPFHLEYNTNRPGSDYGQRATASPEACRAACSADNKCQAFTFVKPPAGASAGQCYLKQAVPIQSGNPCCISAKRKSAAQELIGNMGR